MGCAARYLLVVLIAALCACATPSFPRTLVVVDLTRAPIPVMMSRVKRAPPPGTAPRLASALAEPTAAFGSDTIYTYEEGHTSERSRTGASDKILAQIRAGIGWVEVNAVVFTASDSSELSSSEMRRQLLLQATGRP